MDELGNYINRQHRKFYSNDINDQQLVPLFRKWANENYCGENVEFFLEVGYFKKNSSKSSIYIQMFKYSFVF